MTGFDGEQVDWATIDLADVVLRCVAKVSDVDLSAVSRDALLADVGLDSMAVSEVLVAIEDEIGAEIPDELLMQLDDYETFETVGDVLLALEGPNRQGERGEASLIGDA